MHRASHQVTLGLGLTVRPEQRDCVHGQMPGSRWVVYGARLRLPHVLMHPWQHVRVQGGTQCMLGGMNGQQKCFA